MADQVEALAEQVLQRRWTKAGSTALEATDSYVAGWSSALHPDDIEIRAGSTSEVRAEPSRFDRHANALRRLTSTSLVAAVIAVAVTAGLALWAFGALDAGVDTLDAAVLWAQDRAASDTNDRTTARTTATDRVAADYDARIVATDSRGVRIRTACDDGATTDGAVSEGAMLRVVATGRGDCAGWSLAETSTGRETWVNDRYLTAVAS